MGIRENDLGRRLIPAITFRREREAEAEENIEWLWEKVGDERDRGSKIGRAGSMEAHLLGYTTRRGGVRSGEPHLHLIYTHTKKSRRYSGASRARWLRGRKQDKASILDVKGIGGKRKRWEKKRQVPGVPDRKKTKGRKVQGGGRELAGKN